MQESDLDEIIKDRIREQFGDRTNFIKHLQAEQISYETYSIANGIASNWIRFDWKRSHFPACH